MIVTIMTTRFQNLKTEGYSIGYRLFTDEGHCLYDNSFFESEEEAKECTPEQMLHDIIDNPATDAIDDVIDLIEDGGCTVFIDGEELDDETVKGCFPSL